MFLLGLKSRAGDLNRFRMILAVVFESGGGVLVAKMRLKYLVPWSCKIHCFFHPRSPKKCLVQMEGDKVVLSSQMVSEVLEKLGPTFIKLGQVLSLRADVVGEEISEELSKLQSNVQPFSYEQVRQIIINEFREPPEKIFKSFEKKPVAAASLAQVHRAYLKDGTEVAVKIQRPNIRATIEHDIHILFSLAHLAERFMPELRPYQPVRVVKEFADWTLQELDFKVEGNNAERFRFAFKDNKYINIPKIYWELTTSKILTMDFVHGVKANDVSGIRKLESDSKQLALHGVGAVFQQFLIDGFFHADPHPGNFFAMKGDILCLHDFGMVGYLAPEQRRELVSCFVAFENKDIDGFLRHFMHLAATSEISDVSGFQKDASEILSELLFTPNQPSIAWAFFRLINKGAGRQINFPADLALFGKAIITTEAMGMKLYPEFNFNKELQPFVQKAFNAYLNPKKALNNLKTDIFDYLDFLKNLPEKTQILLKKMEKNDFGVKIDVSELLGIKTEFDRQNDVRVLGGITGVLFIISSIFAYFEGIKSIGGLSFSAIGLIASVILFLWFAARIIKKPKL
ncbi:MAG: AarF/ABC1/UbiB kinase family protein [Candidatus Staskawiczbacteria bacterium]|nr:AarF/ABC1/UbiB kinase family protein [Candidatus Staskawiczbacteria bacterium]